MKRDQFNKEIKKILDQVDVLLQDAADLSEKHEIEFEWHSDIGASWSHTPYSQWQPSACEWEESADSDTYGWHEI